MVIAEAIKAAGSADREAIQEALRKLEWNSTRGKIYFPQTAEPAWKFQQWPEVPIFVIQYSAPNQTPTDAAGLDRKSAVCGKRGSIWVGLGGRPYIIKKNKKTTN